jgi:hypothetical protein
LRDDRSRREADCCRPTDPLDAARCPDPLAADNQLSYLSTYRYLHEAIDVLAAAAPRLHGALLAARLAGHSHVNLDGTLIRTDRPIDGGRPDRGGRPVVVR